MEFLAPVMLVGALGVAVPVIIHLIGRRRAKVVRFAAMDFLMGSNRKVARRFQLRELLLLLIRALACLAIPLALAKPYTTCTAQGPMVERGPQGAVLIIDDSLAATWSEAGETLLDRARRQASDILAQLGPEADVAIVRAAEAADSPTELSRDHIRLRDAIADIQPSFRPPDLSTALRRAAQLLATSPHARRTVYLLSPVTAAGFRGDAPPWPPATGPQLITVPLTDRPWLDNLAVTGLEVEPDPSSGTQGVRVTAEIANFGASPVDQHGVSLRIGGRIVARGVVSLRPGERVERRFYAALPDAAHAADLSVDIDADPLPADNSRHARARLRDEVRALLVNGDPRTSRHEDELFYLGAALRPGDRGDSGISVSVVTADELPRIDLKQYDVVVLANLLALPAERAAALAAWVRAGGGLLVAAGDHLNADDWNRTMLPLLPQELRDPIDLGYGADGAERAGRAQRLTKFDVDHPIFSVFRSDAPGLRDASFTKIMLLGPTSDVDDRRVLARFTDGAAALVEARSGTGRLLFFSSTLDRDWNDLAIHPGYLPLAQQMVRYLARVQGQRSREPLHVGRSILIPVAPDDRRLEISGPRRSRAVLEGEALADRKAVRFASTDAPGFYRVVAVDGAGRERPREEAGFAVNVDPRGSDLRPAPPQLLPASGAEGAAGQPTEHRRRIELWHALAAGLLLLLLVESLLVLR